MCRRSTVHGNRRVVVSVSIVDISLRCTIIIINPVYTIQPVVIPVVKPVVSWYKHSTGCQTRLTTSLTNGCILYTARCQTGCTTQFDNRLNEQWLFVQHGCQRFDNRFDNRLYRVYEHSTGWQPVVSWQPVVIPVVQLVVSCKRGIRVQLIEIQRQHSSCLWANIKHGLQTSNWWWQNDHVNSI